MKFKSGLYFLALSLFSFAVRGQENLFNEENTRKFAEYLLESGQADFAVKEYERLLYLDASKLNTKLGLMKAYRLSGRNDQGVQRTYQIFEDINTMPRSHSIEFSKLLLNERSWDLANTFWDKSQTLPSDDKVLLKSTVSIFDSKFQQAHEQLLNLSDTTNYLGKGYISIVDRGLHGKRKSPFLAGVMSTAIPGLGKAYTGDWKDGLVSLIFTGGMAFQAIRKFNQFGPNNYRPWVYTVIGSGFYLGNIYGSVKSAKNKNIKRINLLQHEASDLFNSYY
ncbi:MAG: hypothetical protein NXI00_08905 [Cytophagales bacterium]|nr:hypothetical protein [Cytophagales bacterium]